MTKIWYVATVALILWVYSAWFLSPINAGGDFAVTSIDQLFAQYVGFPTVWYPHLGNGLGAYTVLPLIYYWVLNIQFHIRNFTSDYNILVKIIYLWPILLAAAISIYIFARKFLQNKIQKIVFTLVYVLNPYVIMLTSGGQAGVATAYMFAPGLIALWLDLVKNSVENKYRSKWQVVSASVGTAFYAIIQSMYDIRIFAVTLIALILGTIGILESAKQKKSTVFKLALPVCILVTLFLGIHSLWIYPALLANKTVLPTNYVSAKSVDFFSFSQLAHTITLSHPFYPANYFGETKEVMGISFVLPFLAFLALKQNSRKVLYFAVISLVGIFLSKGINPPIGAVYKFLYDNVPGMNLFRDASKFYLLSAIGLGFLVSRTIDQILQHKNRIVALSCLAVIGASTCIVWWPTVSHSITGTFKYRTIDSELTLINKIIKEDNNFGRVLWIPSKEPVGYSSLNHPAVNFIELTRGGTCLPEFCLTKPNWPPNYIITRQDRINEVNEELEKIANPAGMELLRSLGIKYIIISPDYDQTLYRHDRKPALFVRDEYIRGLATIAQLQKIGSMEGIHAYEIKGSRSLITATASDQPPINIQAKSEHPTVISFNIPSTVSEIAFAQTYDPSWVLRNKDTGKVYYPEKSSYINMYTGDFFKGAYQFYYARQSEIKVGYILSLLTLIIGGVLWVVALMKARGLQ